MSYTRNNDPNYYDYNRSQTNCGSYALRLKEWFDPEDYVDDVIGDVYDWLYELKQSGCNEWDAACMYGDIIVEYILEEFGDKIQICGGRPPDKPNIELIAFCAFCDFKSVALDWDFHFKVFRDGRWMEKNGANAVHECEEDEWGIYNSDITYMYHTLEVVNGNN